MPAAANVRERLRAARRRARGRDARWEPYLVRSAPDQTKIAPLSTPASCATASEHITSAAAWSTNGNSFIRFVYGSEMSRLSGVGVASSSAVARVGNQAHGCAAATSVKRAISSATYARCSAKLRPARAASTLSSNGYTTVGYVSPAFTSARLT